MTIKVTIKQNSTAAEAFKKYMAEKGTFRKAIVSGKTIDYSKIKITKFATPV